MNEPANDNGKKPRKQRARGPKAPNKKAQPAEWAIHQLRRSAKIARNVRVATFYWKHVAEKEFEDAIDSLFSVIAAFTLLPDDFKAPRKPRAKKDLTDNTDSSNI